MDLSKVYEYPFKEYHRQPRALIGPGTAEMAGPEAARLGMKHVLFVTTGLRGTGIIDELKRSFEDSGVAVTVFDKVESNPKDYNCMDTYSAFMQAKCDAFVSIGGGSAHDTTKAARIVAAHDGRNINEFQGVNHSDTLQNPPHIAINTTIGTGSETTPALVITDTTSPNAPHKWVGFDRAVSATLAINDPVLMMTLPADLVAFTGFDTIAHASESYTTRVNHEATAPLALHAIRLTMENLREVVANPRNYTAMANMVWAEYIAGQALSNGLAGVLHSLSHAVCAYYDIHHGLNNAIGIARVWAYNQPAATAKFADIARAMGVDTRNMSNVQAADAAIDEVIRLAKDCGCPDNFHSIDTYSKNRMGTGWYADRPSSIHSDEAEIDKMATHMMNDLCTALNPRIMTHDHAKALLRECLSGANVRHTGTSVLHAMHSSNGVANGRAVVA
ncbi:MAG: iron-containing alcohol dehydrogenase [Chloroflexaceae bacterium]|nr:iron-containing alcohol dehydrogenase [Chloroflexaceae bacterium]